MLTLRFFLCLLTITLLGGCGSSDGRDTPNRTTTDFIVSVTLPESTAAAMLPAETALHTRSTNAGQRTGDNKVAREADTNQLTIADFAIDRLLAPDPGAGAVVDNAMRGMVADALGSVFLVGFIGALLGLVAVLILTPREQITQVDQPTDLHAQEAEEPVPMLGLE